MMRRLLCVAVAVMFLPIVAAAQRSNPVSDSLRQILQRQSKNLVASAEAMPADKYSFRPTPPQITFGHLVMHVIGSNNFLCSEISGEAKPEGPKLDENDAKEKLVEALKTSFDYCSKALANVDDSKLDAPLKFSGATTATRAMAMMHLAENWADHYAAAAMYLRLNGILPPTAQAKKP